MLTLFMLCPQVCTPPPLAPRSCSLQPCRSSPPAVMRWAILTENPTQPRHLSGLRRSMSLRQQPATGAIGTQLDGQHACQPAPTFPTTPPAIISTLHPAHPGPPQPPPERLLQVLPPAPQQHQLAALLHDPVVVVADQVHALRVSDEWQDKSPSWQLFLKRKSSSSRIRSDPFRGRSLYG